MRKQGFAKILAVLIILLIGVIVYSQLQETFSKGVEPPQQEEENEGLNEEEERRLAEERMREERRQREAALREELGAFFVPLPPLERSENPPVKVKGIYVTGHTAANSKRFTELLALLDSTELNAMVIDVKNDHGYMTYPSEIEIVKEVNANKGAVIKDIDAVMAELEKHDVYPIARIVVFRDPHLPEVKPEWAIQKRNGSGQWRDPKNFAWVNPYDKRVWDYNIAIAKEAALKGFREIQFDYVRFPENAKRVDREAEFPGANGRAKDEAIEAFLAYARQQLAEYNVYISADVFGVIATSRGDADGIGQSWERVSPQVDYICPMIYPSHYGPGYFGYAVPDAHPGGTVSRALTDAIKRSAPLAEPAIIRPWLQSFTATWVKGHIKYGAAEVRAQIEAALALGIDEFLIWNPGNRYITNSYLTAAEAAQNEAELAERRLANGHDVLGRTQAAALDEYLTAVQKKNWRQVYLWQVRNFTHTEEEFQLWFDSWTSSLVSYSLESGQNGSYLVALELKDGDTLFEMEENFTVVMENNVWKVKASRAFLDALVEPPVSGSTETSD